VRRERAAVDDHLVSLLVCRSRPFQRLYLLDATCAAV
jgi:hypothetical protein